MCRVVPEHPAQAGSATAGHEHGAGCTGSEESSGTKNGTGFFMPRTAATPLSR
jgi:hypothetical protein